MKRITTLLRESEAMEVRKAVCVAGAERIVITPVAHNIHAIDPWKWNGERLFTQKHVQLEVTADDDHYGGIVSAIKKISQAGRVILVFRHEMRPNRAV
jgi:nitrogen regulatory protein PII